MARSLRSSVVFTFVVAALVPLAGCAKKPAAREVTTIPVTSAVTPRANVNVSEELVRLCKLRFDDVERAPKFDFDEAALTRQDRDVLEQVAKCVTTGPLKGRRLALVGRADPRGEPEYNMVLGDHRAEAVHVYLAQLGVAQKSMTQTSRGELDALGYDEDGWQRDRRVDIHLDADGAAAAARSPAEP